MRFNKKKKKRGFMPKRVRLVAPMESSVNINFLILSHFNHLWVQVTLKISCQSTVSLLKTLSRGAESMGL